MLLDQLLSANQPLPLSVLSVDSALAKEVQGRLQQAGLLDPPPDGQFGSVSRWALAEFCRKCNENFVGQLSPAIVGALVGRAPDSIFELRHADSAADKIYAAMQRRGYFFNRHPQCLNIVYIEGASVDFKPNKNKPNAFNDVRVLIRQSDKGSLEIVGVWQATTEPGDSTTKTPPVSDGVARIKFGQYKAWRVGKHRNYEALVQASDVVVYRDRDKNYLRAGDKIDYHASGINQHWGGDAPESDVGEWSAGCLVGRTRKGHIEFMELLKQDPRYKANNGYLFMTAIMPASALTETKFDPAQDH